MKSRKKTNTLKKQGGRAYFRLLGLKRGETRVNVIRSAAQSLSISLTHCESVLSQETADNRRAQIAIATYRLLDPRERSDLYERVQLVYPIDREDMETPTIAANTLLDQMPPLVEVENVAGRSDDPNHVKLMDQPVIDEAIDDSADSGRIISLDRIADRVDSSLTIEERRSIVRALKKAQRSTQQGNTPLAWFRTKLGI